MSQTQKTKILAQRLAETAKQIILHPLSWAAILASGAAVTAVAVAVPGDGLLPMVTPVSIALEPEIATHIELGDHPFGASTTIRSQDTIATLLARLAVSDVDALQFMTSDPSARGIARALRPGVQVSAQSDRNGRLVSLSFPSSTQLSTTVIRRSGDGFMLQTVPLTLETDQLVASGTITSSLFAATDAAGLPDEVATGLADIFGSKLDFRKDLRKGDRFSVSYEVLLSEGQRIRTGRILAAEFVNGGRRLTAVWFAPDGAAGEYFGEDGRPLREGFLRSPLEFSRVTSGFSMRMHPILQQWRAHKGVDFGAPTGTRVKVSGSGVVNFVGRQGGYGNFIVVNHGNGISTAYGHLSRFAPGLRTGQRVEQGEVIGYVGQTGWATGPHLHYEFRRDGTAVDPMKVALPSAPPLSGPRLQAFRELAAGQLARLGTPSGTPVALAD